MINSIFNIYKRDTRKADEAAASELERIGAFGKHTKIFDDYVEIMNEYWEFAIELIISKNGLEEK